MKGSWEHREHSQIALEDRELTHLKQHIEKGVQEFRLWTYAVSRFFSSIELFQIRPNEFVRDAFLVEWNGKIDGWKSKCLPKMRANAMNFPPMSQDNIKNLLEFFAWLKELGIHLESIEQIETTCSQTEKALSKPSTP